jgi:hypothetical protein
MQLHLLSGSLRTHGLHHVAGTTERGTAARLLQLDFAGIGRAMGRHVLLLDTVMPLLQARAGAAGAAVTGGVHHRLAAGRPLVHAHPPLGRPSLLSHTCFLILFLM